MVVVCLVGMQVLVIRTIKIDVAMVRLTLGEVMIQRWPEKRQKERRKSRHREHVVNHVLPEAGMCVVDHLTP